MKNLFDDEGNTAQGDKIATTTARNNGKEVGNNGVSENGTVIISGGVSTLPVRRTGRPKKALELALIAAINEAMPPERITEAIRNAYEFSVKHESPKGIMAVLEFVVSYQLGKPVQRMITQRSTVEELLAQASGVDDDEFDALIDAMYDEHSTS